MRAVIARQEIKSIRGGIQPQVDKSLGSAEQQVRAILRPEQAKRFDRIVARAKIRWQRAD
jgi:hypothetical protein